MVLFMRLMYQKLLKTYADVITTRDLIEEAFNKDNIEELTISLERNNEIINLKLQPTNIKTKDIGIYFSKIIDKNKPLRFLAKKELLDPPFGIFFRFAGIIPVNRKIKDKTVLPAASNVLKENYVVVIFPEGTISKTDDLIMPFKKGAAKLAIDNNCPIVPFAINGIYKRNQIIIKVGKKYFSKTDDVEKETKVLENKVTTLLESVIKK